jgi:hypothetical protein
VIACCFSHPFTFIHCEPNLSVAETLKLALLGLTCPQQPQPQFQVGVQAVGGGTPILGSGGIAYRSPSGGRRVQPQIKYSHITNKDQLTAGKDNDDDGGGGDRGGGIAYRSPSGGRRVQAQITKYSHITNKDQLTAGKIHDDDDDDDENDDD